MKRYLLAVMLVTAFSLLARGQNTRALSLTLNPRGGASQSGQQSEPLRPPPTCPSCIFYGGDNNVYDPNTQAFVNGNTILAPASATYAAVSVPPTGQGVITGIFFMEVSALPSNVFDPDTAFYDIRTGVSEGNGGTSVASGSRTMFYAVNQYSDFGTQWVTEVSLAKPLTVTPGTTYWFNLLPQCTDPNNSNCDGELFFLNTTDQTNGIHPGAQPAHEMFLNSAIFGYGWINWCDPWLGQNAEECARGSFGLIGHQ
jgi:hypothetical protein